MAENEDFIGCELKTLPLDMQVAAATVARDYNPANSPPPEAVQATISMTMTALMGFAPPRAAGVRGTETDAESPLTTEELVLSPGHLAVLTSRYWGSSGVKLTVGFPFDSTPKDLQNKILAYANEWGRYANIKFVLTATDPQVRINRAADGYWSYLGTDILSIPKNEPTMNLQGFTMSTKDSEFMRVVPHEFGHCCGFGHEHARKEIVAKLDVNKTIAYFERNQGWSASQTRQQVLTPLNEASIRGTPNADQDSIMCYQLPGSITVDGQPIRGGAKIDDMDGQWSNKLYPKPVIVEPPIPPVTGSEKWRMTMVIGGGFATVEKAERIA